MPPHSALVVAAVVAVAIFVAPVVVAQPNFVYTNDDTFGANTVSGFSAAANGVLSPLPGSPYPTGGSGSAGGFFASNRVTVSQIGNFLYASNNGSSDVSGFSINPVTGVLTPIPGSPFPTGGFGGIGISLAVTPDGQFLIAGNSGSNDLSVFSVAPNGSLTPTVGSPFPAGGSPDGMKVTPDGQFLAVAMPSTLAGAVAVFSIAPNGNLTPVPGSPFPDGGFGAAAGVDVNCRSDLLFAGEANFGSTIVDVFDIAINGSLSPIAGSPFIPGVGDNSNVVLLSPDDQHLFVSNQFSSTVTAFDVAANGALSLVAGSPFAVGGGAFFTSGLATDRAGALLYTASFPNLVGVFTIAANGALTPAPGSPFTTGQPFGLLSLTAYPAKTCVVLADIDIKFCSDPNAFNCKNRGVTPVTIFGSAGLDVADIDLSTLKLCLAADVTQCTGPPRSWSIADRGDPLTDLGADRCAVIDGAEQDYLNPDGFADLDGGFDSQEVAALIGCAGLGKGDVSPMLVILGQTTGGTPLASMPIGDVGIDQLVIKNK